MNLFNKNLRVLTNLTKCFALSYLSPEQTIEILSKSKIDYSEINIFGAAKTNWWNVMVYILSNDLKYLDSLMAVALEDNPDLSCLLSVKKEIEELNKVDIADQHSDEHPTIIGTKGFDQPSSDARSVMENMGNIYISPKNTIGSKIDLSNVKKYKDYVDKSINIIIPRGTVSLIQKNVEKSNSILNQIFKDNVAEPSEKIDKTLFKRSKNSMAVGLVFNAQSQTYCTGFLIAHNVVVMPNFMIKNKNEIPSLQFTLRNPFQMDKEMYSFKSKPLFYDKENQAMLLELNKSVKNITPLPLAIGDAVNKIKGDDIILMSFTNIHKQIADIKDLEVAKDGHELTYTTDSEPGSAGGPILIDGYVVGMHMGKGSKGRKRGVNLLKFEA